MSSSTSNQPTDNNNNNNNNNNNSSTNSPPLLLSRLKFRAVQPVDIPQCHHLESSSYPPKVAASKSQLQYRQHHAAPFFRCVLLKAEKNLIVDVGDGDGGGDVGGGVEKLSLSNNAAAANVADNVFAPFSGDEININNDNNNNNNNNIDAASSKHRRQGSNSEACHHVHHSSSNHLIGFISATRCHDFAPVTTTTLTELKASVASTVNSAGGFVSGSSEMGNDLENTTADTNMASSSSAAAAALPLPQSQPTTTSTNVSAYYGNNSNNNNHNQSCVLFPHHHPHHYPTKHEPNGPILAIHSIVVQKDYRRNGIAKCLLENYIKSIELWNGSVDADNKNLQKNNGVKLKMLLGGGVGVGGGIGIGNPNAGIGGIGIGIGIGGQKNNKRGRHKKIEKIVLVTNSELMDFFVSVGFRWRATVSSGATPLYELEREVRSRSSSSSSSSSSSANAPKNSSSSPLLPASLFPYVQSYASPAMEQECYLVDAFAHPRRCGSGNSAAIVVLQDSPTKMIVDHVNSLMEEEEMMEDYYNNGNDNESSSEYYSKGGGGGGGGMWSSMMMQNDQLKELLSSATAGDEEEEGELAEMRAEVWMHFVAREFNQPATAFVWRVENGNGNGNGGEEDGGGGVGGEGARRKSSHSDPNQEEGEEVGYHFDEDESSSVATSASKKSNVREIHHCIRFFTRAGIEVDMCAHATLASASVLFRRYALEQQQQQNNISQGAINTIGKGMMMVQKETALVFHARKDIVLQALRAPPSPWDEFYFPRLSDRPGVTPLSNNGGSNNIMSHLQTDPTMPATLRIAMDYPWRTVDPVPPGPEGQVAVIAMLRRAFFGAWSVLSPEEEDDDHDTDELAFSLSVHHVLYMGVTKGGEDLLIELTVEGFDLLCGRSVDYVALKQGWSGYTRGVIVCCEVPETLASKAASEEQLNAGRDDIRRPSIIDRQESLGLSSMDDPVERIDFRSRYFEPKVGVNEDPVSGWPHCALGPYFGTRCGKQRLIGIQESERSGLVECILKEDEQQVCIIGSTVTTVAGKLQMQA